MNKKINELPEVLIPAEDDLLLVQKASNGVTSKMKADKLYNLVMKKDDPIFTGHMTSSGTMSIDGKVWSEEEVGSQNILAESYLTLGPDVIIRYISGFSGGSPVYSTIKPEDIMVKNGTNYLMVYGTGTPAENGAELLAAYEEAKEMPRYLGDVSSDNLDFEAKAGQTCTYGSVNHIRFRTDAIGKIENMSEGTEFETITEEDAKSTRTTVIVAPGEYDFGATAFRVNSSGVNIVSLTGNSDVIMSSTEGTPYHGNNPYGIKVIANNILIKGIDCKTNTFYIAGNLDNLICEYCKGGNNSFCSFNNTASGTFNHCIGGLASFGGVSVASGIFNYCIGGSASFGGSGTASGIFNYCIGGQYSFGGDINASGTFNHCIGDQYSFGGDMGVISTAARLYYTRLTSGTFPTPVTGGRLILCIDGRNNVVTI